MIKPHVENPVFTLPAEYRSENATELQKQIATTYDSIVKRVSVVHEPRLFKTRQLY